MISEYINFIYNSFKEYYWNKNPVMANWAITGACNSKCIFCEAPSQLNSSKDLSYDQIFSLVNEMKEIGIRKVHLTGGEVFIRKDIWDIFKLLKSKGIIITMTTNALLIPKFSREKLKIIDENVDRIRISLDSTDSKQYKVIRGVDGFEKVISALKTLKKLKNTKVIITTVVIRDNLKEMPKLVSMASNLNVSFIDFQPVTPITTFTNTVAEKNKTNLLFKNEKDFKALEKYVDDGIRVSKKLKVPTSLPLLKVYGKYYFKSFMDKENRLYFLNIVNKFNCNKLFKSVFIDYDGSIKPCIALPALGNLKDSSLKEEIKKLENIKKNAKKGNHPEMCNKCFCNPGENIVFSSLNHPIANFKALKELILSR